jgi:formylglycine-generating enzyme required for sulfatase activity
VSAGVTSYLKGTGYRLPTEAQWEFACRAGTTTKWCTGDDPVEVLKAAWVNPKSDIRTYPVGELLPNPFGLYDVHGNILEWVQDWWGPAYYQEFADAPAVDPEGPASGGTERVTRGGSWLDPSTHARSAVRLTAPPTRILNRIGFRPVLSVEAVQAARE